MNGKEIRINKLFSNDEHAVIIAIDHGVFNVAGLVLIGTVFFW